MQKPSRKIRIIILSFIVVAALTAAGLYWLPGRLLPAEAASPAVVHYQTARIEKSVVANSVNTTGAVRPNQTATLLWQTTGSVNSVPFALGQTVQKDQVLASLDPTSLPQGVILAQSDLVLAQRALDNLRDSTSAQSQAQLVMAQAQKILDDAKQHRLQLSYRANEDQVLAAEANYYMAQNNVDRLQGHYDTLSHRKENDPARLLALSTLENGKKARDKALISLNWYKGKADPKDIAEADASVAVAQSKLEDAQREWDRLKSGTDPQDLLAAEAKVQAIQATIKLARISAPFNGTLTQVNSKVGDQIQAGTLAFQLDDLSRLLVDVSVVQTEINQIQPGQSVSLEFDAIPNKTYAGVVSEVSTVGKTISGTVNYVITIEVTDKSPEIKSGMTVTAHINVGQAHTGLRVPSRAVRMQANQPVVYLLKDGAPVAVAVSLGDASGDSTEIVSAALQAGQLVILNPPASGN
jgi:HlyD family secretion protein